MNALDFDNASLRRAVAEYLEDPAAAMAQYGGRPMGDWSTWKVTDTSQLFQGATHFNEDISAWDVSSVTTMHRMFAGASSFNAPLADWDVSSVEDFSFWMINATSYVGDDLGHWQTGQATTMEQMFLGATSFVGPANIEDWNVGQVTSLHGMFFGATSFNRPLDNWNVENVKSMNSLLEGASCFDQSICWATMHPAARCFQCFCGAAPHAGFSEHGGSCKTRIHPSVLAYSQACDPDDALEVSVRAQVFARPDDPTAGFLFVDTTTTTTPATDRSEIAAEVAGPIIDIDDNAGATDVRAAAAVQREVSGARSSPVGGSVLSSVAVATLFLFGTSLRVS